MVGDMFDNGGNVGARPRLRPRGLLESEFSRETCNTREVQGADFYLIDLDKAVLFSQLF